MDDPFDTWEHVARDGSHTWSEDPYPGASHDSVLHKAAFSGDIAGLGLSIAGLDDVDIENDHGLSPLHLAVRGNQPEAVRILLLAGADPSLSYAMHYGGPPYLRIVESAAYLGCNEALIGMADYGLELSACALDRAAERGHLDCMLTILKHMSRDALRGDRLLGSIGQALQSAATYHHLQAVEILLSAVPGYPDTTKIVDRKTLTFAMLCMLADYDMEEGCRKVYLSDSSKTLPILSLLISAGAEVDSRAFWAAADHPKWADIILCLLDHGLQVHDMRYWNQFHCCESNEPDNEGQPNKFGSENDGQHMLFKVVQDTKNDTSVLAAFLAAGASVLARDKDQNTPLHLAVSWPASQLLLKHGADLHALNVAGQTPLYTACLHNHLDLARSLLSHGADVAPLVQDRCWLSLISKATPDDWWWPIHWDTEVDHCVEMAKFLLEHGANVQATTEDGLAALHIAARNSHAKLMDFLIAHGSDIGTVTATGQTAIHLACTCSTGQGSWKEPIQAGMALQEHSIRFLLDQGADVNAKDNLGVTPLHGLLRWHRNALDWDHKEFNLLLERGADVDAKAHGDDRTIRSYIDQSRWRFNEIGLLEAVPAKPAHTRSSTSMRGLGRGRGRGRGRGSYRSTWT